MRPLGEVLETVMVDRGGAPLHFVLTHGVFAVDTSADALRWLSVACAVASVPLCFDLGRRLGGQAAGLVAAALAASSTALVRKLRDVRRHSSSQRWPQTCSCRRWSGRV
jgi:4-amino-4-deoxy-L-arabinose transferase-like glycosyltransferase